MEIVLLVKTVMETVVVLQLWMNVVYVMETDLLVRVAMKLVMSPIRYG